MSFVVNRSFFIAMLMLSLTSAEHIFATPNFMQDDNQEPVTSLTRLEVKNPEKSVEISSSDYRLGAGDKIRITIFGEEELSGEFDIDGAGSLSLPLIGQINVRDITTSALERELVQKYADGYLIAPRISVEVTNFRPFFIVGEVSNPGHYPYMNGLTVLSAVAIAGGYTLRAKKSKMQLKRIVSGKEKIQIVNESTLLQPGDLIDVQERFF